MGQTEDMMAAAVAAWSDPGQRPADDVLPEYLQYVAQTLGEYFAHLGVPVVPLTDRQEAQRVLDGSEPVVFEPQLDGLARALVDGQLVELGSFLTWLAANGVVARGGTQPLSVEALTAVLAAANSEEPASEAARVPAFVSALGRIRAAGVRGAPVDPVWGDRMLDPLQLMLLAFGVVAAAGRDRVAGPGVNG